MAITKIKALKTTLDKAINYIINPEKTEDGQLVYSFGCSVGTADVEMGLTAKKGSHRGNRIAYHLIQSFSADDNLTPAQALEIGKEFAQKVTNGKYEFVMSTHADGDNLHNHIIFNATNFVDYKKYHYGIGEKERIRKISDKLCVENNLSVIESFSGKRGKGKYEYEASKSGLSWKDKLRNSIDKTIHNVATFEEFIEAMEMEGYEIKRGKYISFRAPDQERFTRAKRLGDNYTEDSIRFRINNKEKEINQKISANEINHQKAFSDSFGVEKKQGKKKSEQYKTFYQKRINLLVDISKNIKAQQSKGYEQALVRSNINTLVKTMNYLVEHKIETSDEFAVYAEGKNAEYKLHRKSIKKLENELLDLSEKIKFTQNYKKYKSVYEQYQRTRDKEVFLRKHQDEIVLYKASLMFFDRNKIEPQTMNLGELFERYRDIKQEKLEVDKYCKSVKKEIAELEIIAKNIETALGIEMAEKQQDEERTNRNNVHKKQSNEDLSK